MSKKHAVFSASGAHRWLNCPGSIALSAKAPVPPSSSYAEEGTKAHECLEIFLKSKRPYSESFLLKGKYPNDMLAHVFESFKEIEKMQTKGSKLLCETKVSLEFIHPDTFGTVDAGIVEPFGTLHVIDFKYGAGIPVDPKDNPQLAYYALGIAHQYEYDFEAVNVVIIQPRAPHTGSPVKSYTMSIAELLEWKDRFKAGIEAALKKKAELKAGEWCKFCPAAVLCPEISKNALAEAEIDFAPEKALVKTPDFTQLSGARLGRTLDLVERIETWISGVRSHAFETLKRGEEVTGYKLVPRRAMRKWENPAKIEKLARKQFGKEAFEEKFLSPAQFAKKLDKDFVEKYAVAVSSGMTLARESDSRDGVNPIEVDFDELPN